MAQQYNLPRTGDRVELKAPPPVVSTQPPVPLPVAPPPAATAPMRGDPRGLAGFIRETAAKYGVDPEVALRVAKSEGLSNFQSGVFKNGVQEPSFGAFQLYTGGGLGNEFQKETGLDPSDPANEKATIDYALKRAAQGGWGPWYGAKNTGIGEFEGIRGGPVSTAPATAAADDPTPNVGSGETGYRTETASTTTPADDSADKKDKKDKTSKYGEAFGEGLENIGKAYAANKNAAASGPANVPTPILPVPQGPISMVDAKRTEMQRQQLALAMQRLNSGRLV